MSILGFNKVNRSFYRCRHLSGPDFSEAILKDIGISIDVNSAQLDYLPLEGPFITISNHHFGGADGLMLSAIVGAIRPDLKPVSYTHLDVYKRQMFLFFTANAIYGLIQWNRLEKSESNRK